MLYDETSVLHELTRKLSAVERQVIYEIVDANMQRFEKGQRNTDKYEKLKSLKAAAQFQATSTDNEEDSEYDRKLADVNEFEDEKSMEKRAICSKATSPSSYGSME